MEQTDRQRETVVAKHPKLRGRTESKTSRKASRRSGVATAPPIPLPSPTAATSPLMSPAQASSMVSALRIPNGPRSAVVKTSLQTIVAPRTRHTHHHHHRGGRSRGHGSHGSRRHQSARSAPSVAESGARFAGGDPPVDQSPLTLQSSKTQVITADAPAQTLTTITTRASQCSLRAANTHPLSNKGSGLAFVPQSSSEVCVESMASDGQLLCGWDQSLGVVLLQPPNIWNKDQSIISQQSVVPYVSSMLPNFSVWPCYIAPSEATCSTYASPALYGGLDGGLKCRPPSGGKSHPSPSARGVPRRLCSRPRPRACSPSFCGPSRRHVSPSRRTCSPHRRLFSPPRHPCSPISCYRRRCSSPAESCRSRSRTPSRIPYQPISCSPRTPCRPITPPSCRQIVLSCRMSPRSRSPPCRGRSPTPPRRGRSPRYGHSPECGSARRQRHGPETGFHRSRHPYCSQSPMRPPLSSPLPSLPPCSAEHRGTQTRSREVYDTHSDSCCSERRGLSGPAGGGLLCRTRSHRSLHCAAGDYSVRGRCAENYLRSYNSCCPATDQAAWIKFIMRFLQSDELNKAVRCWMQESLNVRSNRSSRQRYFCRRHSSSSVASCVDEAPCRPSRTCSPPPFRPRSRSACRPIPPCCHPSRPRSRSVCHSRTCGRSHSPPRRSLTPPCRSLTPPCRARTPPCRPRTPPCRPRTPPCRPRSPCRPRTPPCRPRTPPCRPRTPPCRPRTPPCRPHTPPCGPRSTPCRPRTPPCNPHTPPPCHSCTPCHQMTPTCQSRSSSHPRTPPCASCQSCRPCTPQPSDPTCSKECKPCRTCDMCPPQPKTCATCKLPCTSPGTTQTSLLCSRPSSRTCWGPCIPPRDCCSTSIQACPREAPSSCPSGSSTVMGGACFGRVPSPPMAPSPPPCMPPPPPCVPPPPPCVPPPPGCAPRPPHPCGTPPPNMAGQQNPCHIRPTPMCNFRPNCGPPQSCTQAPLRPQQSPCSGPPPQCNQPQCGPPQCRPQQCCQPQCTLTPCTAAQVGLQQLSGSTAGAVVPFRNAFNELAIPTQVATNQRSGPVWQSPTTLFQMTVPGPPGGPPVTCTPQPPAMSYCPMRVMYDAAAASAAPCKPSGVPCLNAPPNNYNSCPGAKICCAGGGNGPVGQQGGGSQGTQHNQSCCRHANMLSGPALRLLDELGPMQGPFGRAPFAPPPIPHCTRLKGPCLPRDGTSQQISSVFNEGPINDVTKLGVQQKMGPCQGRGMCCSCSGGGACGGCRPTPMPCYPGARTGPGAGSDADCPCTAGKGPPIDFFRPLEPMVRSQCSSRSSVDAGSPMCSQNCNKMCCVNPPRGTGNLRASLAARETTMGGDPQMSRRSCLPKRPATMRAVNAGGQVCMQEN